MVDSFRKERSARSSPGKVGETFAAFGASSAGKFPDRDVIHPHERLAASVDLDAAIRRRSRHTKSARLWMMRMPGVNPIVEVVFSKDAGRECTPRFQARENVQGWTAIKAAQTPRRKIHQFDGFCLAGLLTTMVLSPQVS